MEALNASLIDDTAGKVRIYFDGACPICTKQVNRALSWDKDDRLVAISTADPDLDAVAENLDLDALGVAMQVKDPEGNIHLGVDGFRVILAAIPSKRWMGFALGLPVVYQCAKVFYRWFAKNRNRFAARCEDGTCNVEP